MAPGSTAALGSSAIDAASSESQAQAVASAIRLAATARRLILGDSADRRSTGAKSQR